jgi:hypothetical protein
MTLQYAKSIRKKLRELWTWQDAHENMRFEYRTGETRSATGQK